MLKTFAEAGWLWIKPNASMFIWVKKFLKKKTFRKFRILKQLLREK